MNFDIGVKSDAGQKRKEAPNQDSVRVYLSPDGKRPPLVLVADGMGGLKGGALASQTVSEYFTRGFESMPLDGDLHAHFQRLLDYTLQGVKYVSGQNSDDLSQMGSTLVAAILLDDRVHMVNVGDSRAYMINSREIRQISQDQTVVAEGMRAGIITPAEAEVHPKRHVLSMSLSAQREVVRGFSDTLAWAAGDALLLCSDGLWNVVPEEDIWKTVCSMQPQAAAAQLVDLANAAGGPDNISVIVVRRAGEAPELPGSPLVKSGAKKPGKGFLPWTWIAAGSACQPGLAAGGVGFAVR